MGEDKNKALREFLESQGFSDAAIEEFFKGNSIQITFVDYPTPWPATVKLETVYKDGEIVNIDPKKNGGKDKTD
jgi:hypothetical protein